MMYFFQQALCKSELLAWQSYSYVSGLILLFVMRFRISRLARHLWVGGGGFICIIDTPASVRDEEWRVQENG